MILISTYLLSFTSDGMKFIHAITQLEIEKNYVINVRHSDASSKEFEMSNDLKKSLISNLIKTELKYDVSEMQCLELLDPSKSEIKGSVKSISLQW